MTKSTFKKEKDKLLISKNTTIGRLRANDKELIQQLRKLTAKEKIKELIQAVEQQYTTAVEALKERFEQEQQKKQEEKNTLIKLQGVDYAAPNTESQTVYSHIDVGPSPAGLPTQAAQVKVEQPKRLRSDNKADVAPKHLKEGRKRTASLRIWQRNAANNVLDCIERKDTAHLLQSGTGTGKTFIIGDVIQQLHDSGWFKSKWPTFYPCLIVTPATVVPQFINDMKYRFGLEEKKEFFVTNYEQLRTNYGTRYITKKKIVNDDGDVKYEYDWIPYLNPPLIIWDECHKLKNPDSTQHKIALALHRLPEEVRTTQVYMSATPWSRIEDTKCFSINAELQIK